MLAISVFFFLANVLFFVSLTNMTATHLAGKKTHGLVPGVNVTKGMVTSVCFGSSLVARCRRVGGGGRCGGGGVSGRDDRNTGQMVR